MSSIAPRQAAVQVNTPGHCYDIVIAHGAMADPASWLGLPVATQAVIITNTTVRETRVGR